MGLFFCGYKSFTDLVDNVIFNYSKINVSRNKAYEKWGMEIFSYSYYFFIFNNCLFIRYIYIFFYIVSSNNLMINKF